MATSYSLCLIVVRSWYTFSFSAIIWFMSASLRCSRSLWFSISSTSCRWRSFCSSISCSFSLIWAYTRCSCFSTSSPCDSELLRLSFMTAMCSSREAKLSVSMPSFWCSICSEFCEAYS
jgi:hypothetical protein